MDRTPPPNGDVDRGDILKGVSWALAIIAICFVSLRVYCRTLITRNMWWDDWMIVLTMIWSLTFTIMWTVYANVGGTRHVFYLSLPQQENALKLNWISQTFCVLGLAFGKLSVGFLIYRIGVPKAWTRWLLYFFMTSQFILFSLAFIFVFVQCQPVTKLWNFTEAGNCWDPQVLTVWTIICSSYSAFLDIALAAIPVSVIWSLQMSFSKKVQLSLILSVGIFAAICGAIKTSKLPSESARSDFTWNTVPLFIWNSVEINVVIVAACVPTLRPMYLILFGRPGAEHYGRKGITGSSRSGKKSHGKNAYVMHSDSRDGFVRRTPSPVDGRRGDGMSRVADVGRQYGYRDPETEEGSRKGITQTVEMDVRYADGQSLERGQKYEDNWERSDSAVRMQGIPSDLLGSYGLKPKASGLICGPRSPTDNRRQLAAARWDSNAYRDQPLRDGKSKSKDGLKSLIKNDLAARHIRGFDQLELLTENEVPSDIYDKFEQTQGSCHTQFPLLDIKGKRGCTQGANGFTVPYESHIGAILGSQFRTSAFIRSEACYDVYALEDLFQRQDCFAKAYTLRGTKGKERDARLKNLKRGSNNTSRMASIDQNGRKWLVFSGNTESSRGKYISLDPLAWRGNEDYQTHFPGIDRRQAKTAYRLVPQPNYNVRETDSDTNGRSEELTK
ncbi:MAG: hypothetical protein OHK93_005846 [Ramalina farinacea]|uniref:Rhodopsin domain-containing protein n=1 Tax=Ramalina farinacea TaxID=258253 RepID=A0AA43TT01_9LECA|nr:hypothetical protein [Ramalina farinacea]